MIKETVLVSLLPMCVARTRVFLWGGKGEAALPHRDRTRRAEGSSLLLFSKSSERFHHTTATLGHRDEVVVVSDVLSVDDHGQCL